MQGPSMEQPILLKLNRFISLQSPFPSPPPPTNNPNNLLTTFLHWLSALPSLFLSLLPTININSATLSRWLSAATPWLIGGAVLLALCCCLPVIVNLLAVVVLTCLGIIKWVVVGIWSTSCWVVMGVWSTCKAICCCFGSTSVKMMKAPGTGGLIMARSVFEAAPKVYFASLRAGSPLLS